MAAVHTNRYEGWETRYRELCEKSQLKCKELCYIFCNNTTVISFLISMDSRDIGCWGGLISVFLHYCLLWITIITTLWFMGHDGTLCDHGHYKLTIPILWIFFYCTLLYATSYTYQWLFPFACLDFFCIMHIMNLIFLYLHSLHCSCCTTISFETNKVPFYLI